MGQRHPNYDEWLARCHQRVKLGSVHLFFCIELSHESYRIY